MLRFFAILDRLKILKSGDIKLSFKDEKIGEIFH